MKFIDKQTKNESNLNEQVSIYDQFLLQRDSDILLASQDQASPLKVSHSPLEIASNPRYETSS